MDPNERAKMLGEGKILSLIWKFSIPAIVGMLTNALYNVVDRVFLGRGVGSLALAGITVCFPIQTVMMAFSMLIGVGSATLISIRLGQGKKEEASRILGQAVLFMIIIFGVFTVVGLLLLDKMLFLFGATETNLPYAREYMSVILLGSMFYAFGMGLNFSIRAEGNPRIAMATMLIGGVLNIILDPIFIYVLNKGIWGAAVATVISQMVSAIWVLTYFTRGQGVIRLQWRHLRVEWRLARQVFTNGSASFALQLVNSLMNVILNQSLKTYGREYSGGDTAISAMGIIQSVFTFVLMPIFGLNHGLQPIFGYNYGARKIDRVFQTLKYGYLFATCICTASFLVLRFFPAPIIQIFNKTDTELLEMTVHAAFFYSLMIPVIGVQVVSVGFFQALGKPKSAMFLSLSRQILFLIPLLLLLPRFFKLDGIWYSFPICDALSFVVAVAFVTRETKKLRGLSTRQVEGNL
ncbi:MAG: MATE family efflux transporter [Thermotogota bacterium]